MKTVHSTLTILEIALLLLAAIVAYAADQEGPSIKRPDTELMAELMEQRADRLVEAIRSGDTASAQLEFEGLGRKEEDYALLRGKPALRNMYDLLVGSTNEQDNVYLMAILSGASDPALDDDMSALADSKEVAKKGFAALYFLVKEESDAEEILRSYDILAELASDMAEILNEEPQRLTQREQELAQHVIVQFNFNVPRMVPDLDPLRNRFESLEVSGLSPLQAMAARLAVIQPWWRTNRLRFFESIQNQ